MALPARFFVVIVFISCVPLFLDGPTAGAEILRNAGVTILQRDFMRDAAHRFGTAHDVSPARGSQGDAGSLLNFAKSPEGQATIAKKFIPLTDK